MKFARELVEEQVPEWRAKYLDYKQSKRRIKAVSVAAARYATTSQNGPFKRHSQHTTISSPTITPLLCEISPPATRPHSVDGSRPAPLPPHSVFFPENTHHGPKNTCQSPARSKLTRGRSFNGTLRSHFTGPQVIEGLRSTLEQRQHEFFAFLTTEFEKISLFYKERENEATSRLEALRRQLQFFHDQKEDKAKARAGGGTSGEPSDQSVQDHHGLSIIYHPLDAARSLRFRSRTSNTESTGQFRSKDYVPRPYPPSVKFSAARRKLKRGMRDYYRYLEYVRSYGLMNRLAFRKANKKYDKVVKAHPRLEFVSTFVDNAYFVKSDVIDSLMSETEDLYAEHFEDGNRKVAVSKLKKKAAQDAAHNGSVFRNGLLLGIGLVFGVQGLISAAHIIIDGYDATLSQQTSLLLQLYGGYSLILFLTFFFCLDCRTFDRARINYVFVFEFDPRDRLDWRQLCEIPCLLFFSLGFIIWLNFQAALGVHSMFLYWPLILIGGSLSLLFFPAPIFYHSSRRWFLVSCVRLLVAPFVSVNFRDFFLGDMCCSLTYVFGNVELLPCLYAHNWTDLSRCGSTHSRLFGFLQTYPGIIRALQCLRRLRETGKPFPQFFNFLKYACTIGAYAALSAWRIDGTLSLRAFFMTVAIVNSVFCSIWDIWMDWSLGQRAPTSPKFLRPFLGYPRWYYYVAIPLNVLLRFNWVFYLIFPSYSPQSSVVSYLVALSEVFRRGVWSLFRIENEHCNNVEMERAWRDVDLPYGVVDGVEEEEVGDESAGVRPGTRGEGSIRNIPAVGISRAHTVDFVRRRTREDEQEEEGTEES